MDNYNFYGITTVSYIMALNHAENENNSHGIAFTQESVRYHRDLVDIFEQRFEGEIIRADIGEFDNGMPLVLVGETEKALYLTWIPGDNFAEAFTNMCFVGAAFTDNPDVAGPNVQHLGIFAPFFDARMDHRGRKIMPDGNGRAIIKSMSATIPPLARAIRYVAKAEYLATLNLHSYEASQILEQNGVEVINLTAARLFAEKINGKPIKSERRRVVVTTDAGDFNHALPFASHLNAELAVVLKIRDPEGEGKKNKVSAQLVYGNVAGSDVYILDDSISGASTIQEAVHVLGDANSITYCATHPVFVGDYYTRIEEALENPLINSIMITDSLPTKYRKRLAAIPYAKLPDNTYKDVEVVPVGSFLADAAHIILHSDTASEAKNRLGADVWEMKNPQQLFQEHTGLEYPVLLDTGVYLGRKKTVTLFEYQNMKK